MSFSPRLKASTTLALRSLVARFSAATLATVILAAGLGAVPADASTGSDELRQEFTASNGLTSAYHYYPSGKANSGLIVYLDGDGQYAYYNPDSSYALGGSAGIVSQGRSRGMDVMAVKTPNRGNTWWTACEQNADYLNELLRSVKAQRGTDNKRVWITGYSGGAQFTTMCFMPQYSNTIDGGGTVVFGGGGEPWDVPVVATTAEHRKSISMNWITGLNDTAANSPESYDALGQARLGEAFYSSLGYPTWASYPAGVDHLQLGGLYGKYIGESIDRAAASTTPVPTPTPTPTPTPSPSPGPTPTPVPEPGGTVVQDITRWDSTVKPARTYVDISVTVPRYASKHTTIRIQEASGKSVWQEYVRGSGAKSVRLGDGWKALTPGAKYQYLVINGHRTQASGTFTTRR